MYTAKILRKTIDKQLRKVYVDLAYYSDGAASPDATETREFGIEVSLEDVLRYAAQQVARFDKAATNIADIVEGELDIASIKISETAAEKAKREWFADLRKLEQVQKLVGMGVLTGLEKEATGLLAKVKDSFKQSYLNEV